MKPQETVAVKYRPPPLNATGLQFRAEALQANAVWIAVGNVDKVVGYGHWRNWPLEKLSQRQKYFTLLICKHGKRQLLWYILHVQ